MYLSPSLSTTDEELQSSNRRIQIVNEGRQLRVVLLQSSDRGTYRCRGENSAGSVEASARLTVIQTGKGRRKVTQGNSRFFTIHQLILSTSNCFSKLKLLMFWRDMSLAKCLSKSKRIKGMIKTRKPLWNMGLISPICP